ncbi:hypothetical protein TWF481_002850 [Arthrobotrys musiformis]|uniref:Uncharacterized protein n=1 Tax=Arthrobotrys musiformis TaxID=47236 RepID=A0AAV9VRJ9_9PEZI
MSWFDNSDGAFSMSPGEPENTFIDSVDVTKTGSLQTSNSIPNNFSSPSDILLMPIPALITPRTTKGTYREVASLRNEISAPEELIKELQKSVDKIQNYLAGLIPWTIEMNERMNNVVIEIFGEKEETVQEAAQEAAQDSGLEATG